MPRLSPEDWDSIRAEWIAGTLSIRQIAKTFGCSPKTIRDRAAAESWPPRNQVTDEVREIIRAEPTTDAFQSNRLVLQSFDRVIQLLRAHRKDIAFLRSAIFANLQGVAEIVESRAKTGRALTLKERQLISAILRDASVSMARLIPLERRAFGLSNEEISEFDSFTSEQLDQLEATVRRQLG